jgi:hypothetical protein|nr:hypothetical protein [Oxalobacteraceae bacterium]
MTQRIKLWNSIKGPVREFGQLRGRILCGAEQHGDELRLYLTDTHYVRFYHQQACCESVSIEDICGDLSDLVGEPLTEAEEVRGYTGPEQDYESYTWTFYRFATRRGSVTVRWLGHSNGYYSERVSVDIIGGPVEEE